MIVNDWFKKGIVFKDIIFFMNDGEVYCFVIDKIVEYVKELKIDIIVGLEVCGFIIGCLVVYVLGIGFVFVCKLGKFFCEIIEMEYDLEYGMNKLFMYSDVIKLG